MKESDPSRMCESDLVMQTLAAANHLDTAPQEVRQGVERRLGLLFAAGGGAMLGQLAATKSAGASVAPVLEGSKLAATKWLAVKLGLSATQTVLVKISLVVGTAGASVYATHELTQAPPAVLQTTAVETATHQAEKVVESARTFTRDAVTRRDAVPTGDPSNAVSPDNPVVSDNPASSDNPLPYDDPATAHDAVNPPGNTQSTEAPELDGAVTPVRDGAQPPSSKSAQLRRDAARAMAARKEASQLNTEHTGQLNSGQLNSGQANTASGNATPNAPSALRAELKLVVQARTLMKHGRHDEAKRILDEYQRRFPEGRLMPEAKAMVQRLNEQ